MTYVPHPHATNRSPRARLSSLTPAVLRSQNGSRSRGELEIIFLTGGLLCLPKPFDRGSCVQLIFMTHAGPVLGAAEMLKPVSWGLQPFRWLTLDKGDQGRLKAAIQSSLGRNSVGDKPAQT